MTVYKIRFKPEAEDDLDDIGAMLAKRVGYMRARQMVTRIVTDIDKLERFPKRGSLRDEFLPGLRVISAGERGKANFGFLVHDDDCEVEIWFVTYGGADWQSRIRERVQ